MYMSGVKSDYVVVVCSCHDRDVCVCVCVCAVMYSDTAAMECIQLNS